MAGTKQELNKYLWNSTEQVVEANKDYLHLLMKYQITVPTFHLI